jgi:hypothetical protein
MKFLKQNNINPKRITDKSVYVNMNGEVVLTPDAERNIDIESDRAIRLPRGTNAQRPVGEKGLARYNTDTDEFEGFNGVAWASLGGVRDVDGDTFILAEPFPGANTNILLFSTNGIISTTADRFGIKTKKAATTDLEVIQLNPDNTEGNNSVFIESSENMTSSYRLTLPQSLAAPGTFLGLGVNGQLLFESLDQAGNRVYCSAKVGDDLNDGILKPVKTLRKALQIASGLVYKPTFEYNEDLCKRDTYLIISAAGYDGVYNSNWQVTKAALTYYMATASEVVTTQKTKTLEALNFLKTKVLELTVSQTTKTRWTNRLNNVITIFDQGPTSAPGFGGGAVFMDDPVDIDPGVSAAKELLLDNVEFIADEVIAWINARIAIGTGIWSGFTYDSTKCRRDTKLIVYSVIYDLVYGGNTQSRDAGLKYYDGLGDDSTSGQIQIPGQILQTTAAIERAKSVAQLVAQNLPVTVSGTLSNTQNFSSPGGSLDASTTVGDLFDIVTNIVSNGPTAAPIPVLPTATQNVSLAADKLILDQSADRIADNVIAYTSGYIPNGVKITVAVASGEYNEENPLIIPDNVSVVGDGLRSCIIRPINANKDMFKVRNGCYFTEFTFRDKLDENGVPTNTWNYAFSFDEPNNVAINRIGYANLPITKPVISTSPYMQNCSMISFLGGNGVLIDGNLVETPNRPPLNQEVEKPVDLSDGVPEQGKSMVANAFTMISFGGTGWRLINDAYAQLVSCFQIFMLNGTYCQSGGYVSVTNSATNFGKYALRASGYSPNAFIFDRGYIAGNGLFEGEQTLKIVGYGRVPINHFVLRFRNAQNVDVTEDFKPALEEKQFNAATAVNTFANILTVTSHGYSEAQEVLYLANGNTPVGGLDENQIYYVGIVDSNNIKLYFDEDKTLEVALLSASTGNHSLLSNVEEFFINSIIDSHNVYQRLTLASGTYTFTPGATITASVSGVTANAFVYSYDPNTRQLIISINKVPVGVGQERVLFTPGSQIDADQGTATNISVTNADRLTDIFSAEVTVKSTVTNNQIANISTLTNFQLYLHRPSIVNSSAHTWEYAGSGIDYNALPQNGGKGDTRFEQFSELPGRVYTSGTNELGDFKVGDFITAENKTGNISFRNKVIVSELTALKLSLSDIEIEQLSIDVGLGDNEPGGATNTRLSTQLAIRSFLRNRLGKFIDKDLSTNSVPGAVVQLNSSGQINSDLIPATRNFSVNSAEGYNGRLFLADDIPAANILAGDIASEEYEKVTLTLDNPVNGGVDGELITQPSSGAQGYLIGNVNGLNVISVGSIGREFGIDFVSGQSVNVGDSTAFGVSSVSAISNESINYFLSNDAFSQYLIVSQDYNFTIGNTVTSVVNQAQGTITAEVNGVLTAVNNAGIAGGTGYEPAVSSTTYYNVPLTNISGTGTNARADITVANGSVTIVDIHRGGSGYLVGDVLSADHSNLGGIAPGQAFQITASGVENRLYVNLIGNIKFIGSSSSPDFVEDNNPSTFTITLTNSTILNFNAPSVGGNVDYTNSRINISHSFSNGDPVAYSSGANLAIGGLTDQEIYYVKVIDSTNIELYTEYSLVNKVVFSSDSTGTHSLTRSAVMPDIEAFVYVNHGLSSGDAIKITGNDLPAPLLTNTYFYVGGVTVNSFTLHTNRGEALTSISGVTVNPQLLADTGSGTAVFTKQNVAITGVINTSSKTAANWKLVNASTINASSIVSGVIATSRLATSGTANSGTFLRGDSTWSPAVASIKTNTSTSPLSITGDGDNNNGYYGTLSIDVNRVDAISGTALYSSLGTARFLLEQFDVGLASQGTAGNIAIKNGVIDAGTLDGFDSSYFLNPANLSSAVPINKGGTGLSSYAVGDLIYANSAVTFGKIAIASKNKLLAVTEPVPGTLAPGWVEDITIQTAKVGVSKTATSSIAISNTFPTVVDSFDKTIYRSANYVVQISNLTDLSYQVSEILIIHNGGTISKINEFGATITNNIAKGTFTTNIVGNNCRLLFTSFNTNSLQIKILKTYLEI